MAKVQLNDRLNVGLIFLNRALRLSDVLIQFR